MANRHEWAPPTCFTEYLDSLQSPKEPHFELVERLDCGHIMYGRKDAWVVRDTSNDVVCLQSYATVVSVKSDKTAIHLGYWSKITTTHQHIFEDYCKEH